MKNIIYIVAIPFSMLIAVMVYANVEETEKVNVSSELSLITKTPEDGFQLAIDLSRKGVTSTQTDREVLFILREAYSKDPDALIASSQVIAIHFQTIAAANNYWRD